LAKQPTLFIQRSSMLNGINGVGKTLRKVGLAPFKLDADLIIKKAKKKAGFDDSLPKAEEGLRVLVRSINEEGRPNPFGALAPGSKVPLRTHILWKVHGGTGTGRQS
jgi:hypothetical protein